MKKKQDNSQEVKGAIRHQAISGRTSDLQSGIPLPDTNIQYKCGHKTKGIIILDNNEMSMSKYIQWAEEEDNLNTNKECFDCFLKRDNSQQTKPLKCPIIKGVSDVSQTENSKDKPADTNLKLKSRSKVE